MLRRFRALLWSRREFTLSQKECMPGDAAELPEGFRWMCVETADQLGTVWRMVPLSLRGKFRERLAGGGQHCFLAEKEGVLAYFLWLSTTIMDSPEIGFRQALPRETAYMYHGHTYEAYRGKGLHTLMCKNSFAHMAGIGVQRCLVLTETDNPGARKAHARAGFKEISRVQAGRLLGAWRYEPADWVPKGCFERQEALSHGR